MRIIVTGGGTGGHVYPALEVARLAQARGAVIRYYGSLRGMEGGACAARDISFFGYPAGPVTKSVAGVRAVANLVRSISTAMRELRRDEPQAVFSTGGYSSAPTLWAARSLKIPYCIHDSNSVPGRVNRMFGASARSFTYTFRSTVKHLPTVRGYRTGQPIRADLRTAVTHIPETKDAFVLILGGSQGSRFLNESLPAVAEATGPGVQFVLAAGKGQYEAAMRQKIPANLEVVPYLDQLQLVEAYTRARVVIARSGGTLAELAMFGLPSVLVPLPTSADDHQFENAREFAELGAATVLWQPDSPGRQGIDSASPDGIATAVQSWLTDAPKCASASQNLRSWDVPDATDQIVDHLFRAAQGL